MNSYIKYSILLEEYKKIKEQMKKYKENDKNKEIKIPIYENINEADYPPQAF
tara:strand:- start:50 stop:205 length:156 start_codon:yes stop_codon:yes gene_type:complete